MLTCYFDTYHWNRLAAGKLDADLFKDAVRQDKIVPVLSFIHMLEFALRKPESTRAIVATFIDEIIELGTVKWIHLRGSIETAEYRNEFSRFMGWPIPNIQVLENTLTDVMPHELDREKEASWRQEPIVVQLENLYKSKARRDGYLEFRQKEHPSQITGTLAEPWQRALGLVGDSILMPDGRIRPMTQRVALEFRDSLNLQRCPSAQLSYAYNTQWIKNPPAVKESDFEDLLHLAGVAYCDIAFADARTCELLNQGKITPLPKRNGEFKDWVRSL